MSVHHAHTCLVPSVPRREYQTLRNGITEGFEPPAHGFCELRPGPLEERLVFLMAEQPLDHPLFFTLTLYLKAMHYTAFHYCHDWKHHKGKTSEGGCK